MTRQLTALFAALEALLVVGVGIGIPLVPLTLMWAIQYGLQFDWVDFWRASVDSWLLGHGVDVLFTLDPSVAASTGLGQAGLPFEVTIAPLAFSLITVLLGVRAGRRIGETPYRILGLAVAAASFGVLSFVVTLTAVIPSARPSSLQGVFLPTLVFALGLGIGTWVAWLRSESGGLQGVGEWLDARVPGARDVAATALAGGVAAAALVVAVATVAVGALLAVNYAQVIALYEGVQSGVLGGAALTVAQLAFLPNIVIWAAAWFVGPGFAIGAGSSVSPLGTALGPVPAIPMLGAVPVADLSYGFLGILVPVLAGFASGVILRPRLLRAGLTTWPWLVGAGLGMGLAGGLTLGALSWISAGSAGPGRLEQVGPSWLGVGGFSALEIGLAATVALLAAWLRERQADAAAAADVPAAVLVAR